LNAGGGGAPPGPVNPVPAGSALGPAGTWIAGTGKGTWGHREGGGGRGAGPTVGGQLGREMGTHGRMGTEKRVAVTEPRLACASPWSHHGRQTDIHTEQAPWPPHLFFTGTVALGTLQANPTGVDDELALDSVWCRGTHRSPAAAGTQAGSLEEVARPLTGPSVLNGLSTLPRHLRITTSHPHPVPTALGQAGGLRHRNVTFGLLSPTWGN
jgi:hypothetical protein